jgi:hypothetical protein
MRASTPLSFSVESGYSFQSFGKSPKVSTAIPHAKKKGFEIYEKCDKK